MAKKWGNMIGIDEVGRGAWAGPLLVAAVRLHADVEGLTDSKLLSKTKREKLCPLIQANADIGLGWLAANDIDRVGLGEALRICAQAAAEALQPTANEIIIIDGSVNLLGVTTNVKCEPKAEIKYPAVAAASIVAKVFRDRYMQVLHAKHPLYAFDRHVGYGTASHTQAIADHGVLEAIHRLSFKPVAASIAT